MAKPVDEQKREWIDGALKSGRCSTVRCHKCGSEGQGCFDIVKGDALCLNCMADAIFYTPPKPRLDLEDFARI